MKRLLLLLLGALAVACSSQSNASPGASICKAGTTVYCRCQNRDEGSKTCKDDGSGYDRCEPCESDTNPEDSTYVPPTEYPGGPESDSGTKPTTGTCGDKIVQPGEQCDDGNADDHDGCDATCKLAGVDPAASRTCPGLPVHVGAALVTYASTTIGAPNSVSVKDACTDGGKSTTGGSAADRIFAVTPDKSGTLVVSTKDATFDNWLYVVEGGCTNGAQPTYLACANKQAAGTPNETLSVPVEAGKLYSVIVDGVLNAQGGFTIELSVQ